MFCSSKGERVLSGSDVATIMSRLRVHYLSERYILVDPTHASTINSWILSPEMTAFYTEALWHLADHPSDIGTSNLPFLDGTDWPEEERTKGAYLKQGGTIVQTPLGERIGKPPWVLMKTLGKPGVGSGEEHWDWCTLCKQYCTWGHVSSRKHWKKLTNNLVHCVPCTIPLPPRTEPPPDTDEAVWL